MRQRSDDHDHESIGKWKWEGRVVDVSTVQRKWGELEHLPRGQMFEATFSGTKIRLFLVLTKLLDLGSKTYCKTQKKLNRCLHFSSLIDHFAGVKARKRLFKFSIIFCPIKNKNTKDLFSTELPLLVVSWQYRDTISITWGGWSALEKSEGTPSTKFTTGKLPPRYGSGWSIQRHRVIMAQEHDPGSRKRKDLECNNFLFTVRLV